MMCMLPLVAARNQVGRLIAGHMLDHGLTFEEFGALVGLSGMTIRRMVDPDKYGAPVTDHTIKTKFAIARRLREDPSTLWPPIRSRKRVAA